MPRKTTLWGLVCAVMLAGLFGITLHAGPGTFAAGSAILTPSLIPDPLPGAFDPAAVAMIDLSAYPIVPPVSAAAQLIYQQGMENGGNPHTFAKVGDCMTDTPYFLIPIGDDDYLLGDYEALQPVIEHYTAGDTNSFSRVSQAAAGGFNTASVLDSLWANPEFCEPGETPLTCEFRVVQPSVALIMFGTNDVFYLDEARFDFFLRSVVVATIRNGTLPILSTFPVRPEFPDKSLLYNQIVVRIALDYDIPLINLWLALADLPDQGVNMEDTTHLTEPDDGRAADFTSENLQTGAAMRNLVTLQALDAVLAAVRQP